MAGRQPFILLDDARKESAAPAHLYETPEQVFVAYRPGEVVSVLEAARAAQGERGGTLAGYLAYEAGLALEPKLARLAAERSGGAGPLVWFGLFEEKRVLEPGEVSGWLAGQAEQTPASSLGPLVPQLSCGGYHAAFERLQEAIRAGDIYQANLTFPLASAWRGDPLAIYAGLRCNAGAGYGGVVFDGSDWLLSSSPELFVSLKGRSARVKPMKGTRPRGRSEEEDAALAADLAASAKDKAENLMIVDLMRNDLSRVADAGTVRVDDPFAIESYPTVHQMTTTVHAELAEGAGAMDLLRALFPCGSITGAPKIRAMELIAEVERDARGPYCGAIGRIGPDGDAAFNVAIRTLRLTPTENARGTAVLGVGSAIVADSEPLAEWRECLVKADYVRRAPVAGLDLIETMRFDPEEGIPLLERHLERMKASAATLGFSFDRHAARNAIQALCFELDAPAKLRLMLAKSGETSLETARLPSDPEAPLTCAILPLPVDPGDFRLRHKTTDRHFYADALAAAKEAGADEALLLHPDGTLTEGSFSNLFVERKDGTLATPPAAFGLLPGVLRASLLDQGSATEGSVRPEDLSGGFWLGNAVRGLVRARLMA